MFKKEIENSIGKILIANNHIKYNLSCDTIYFCKRYSDELAFYLRCKDGRNRGFGIMIDLFFSPIQAPCDVLERFDIGIRVNVATVYSKENEEELCNWGKKIIDIEKNISCFENMIMNEFHNPYNISDRYEFYMKNNYNIYNTVYDDDFIKQSFLDLKKDLIPLVKKKQTAKFNDLCNEFVNKHQEKFLKHTNNCISTEYIKRFFSEHVYDQCLLDI